MATDAERATAAELDNARLRAELDHATKAQLTREDLADMSPGEIATATKAGRLKDVLTGKGQATGKYKW